MLLIPFVCLFLAKISVVKGIAEKSIPLAQVQNIPLGRKLIRAERVNNEPLSFIQEVAAGGHKFIVDADPKDLKWNPKSISVILPCAEEREYAVKTVQSIFNNTPAESLLEIIVVDDGSSPPLSETHMHEEFQKKYKTKVFRHEQTVGLIGAKKTGGDGAQGDVLVFFDCHVAPQPNWEKQFVSLVAENYRRIVVPQITDLDIDTWTQRGGGGMSKCYLTWDCDFKWFDSDDMYIAVISGGLLGMSRQWWKETGGYDKQMMGWGGENLDQSLRTWLCGGEIVNAAESQVAHMWRVGKDPRTFARYRHVGDTGKNRARAVYAWYGEFAEKLGHFAGFSRKNEDGKPWYGDLSNIVEVKNQLGCRPFSWFLRRFHHIYEDAGLIPNEVFMLKEPSTGKCLRFTGNSGTAGGGFGGAKLASCDQENHRNFWHRGNKNRHGKCCGGLRAWNTDQCMEQFKGHEMGTGVCDVSGRNTEQAFQLTKAGFLRRRDQCLIVLNGTLHQAPCKDASTVWQKQAASQPLETTLYTRARTEHPETFAKLETWLSANEPQSPEKTVCQQASGGCFKLFHKEHTADKNTAKCLDDNMQFSDDHAACTLFFFKENTLRPASDKGVCVDRWNDEDYNTWGTYNCHTGETQRFLQHAEGTKYCNTHDECFAWEVASLDV